MTDYQEEREAVAYFMRRLYRQFLTTASGGNISCRTADGNIVITASQSDKGEQSPDKVGIVTMNGENLTPRLDEGEEGPYAVDYSDHYPVLVHFSINR